ncbi:hypothetical protein Tco_0089621 [Tanacetum coccineum]
MSTILNGYDVPERYCEQERVGFIHGVRSTDQRRVTIGPFKGGEDWITTDGDEYKIVFLKLVKGVPQYCEYHSSRPDWARQLLIVPDEMDAELDQSYYDQEVEDMPFSSWFYCGGLAFYIEYFEKETKVDLLASLPAAAASSSDVDFFAVPEHNSAPSLS